MTTPGGAAVRTCSATATSSTPRCTWSESTCRLPSADESDEGAFLACSVVALLLIGALGLWIYGGIQLWHNVVADWF